MSLGQHAFPNQVLMSLVNEIVDAFLDRENGDACTGTQTHNEEELVPESPCEVANDGRRSMEPLLAASSTKNSSGSERIESKRLYGYLHLLNVFIPSQGSPEELD